VGPTGGLETVDTKTRIWLHFSVKGDWASIIWTAVLSLTATPVTNRNRSEYFLALIYGTATYFVTVSWARAQKCEERLLDSSCLSIRPHGTTPIPLEGFLRNLIFEYFSKNCLENSTSIEIGPTKLLLYMNINIHFWIHVAHFFLEWEMFHAKIEVDTKTYILGSVTLFPPKIVPSMR